jgi:hypothetical protein
MICKPDCRRPCAARAREEGRMLKRVLILGIAWAAAGGRDVV